MIKSVKQFNGILLHFFLSVGFLGSWRSPDWRFFASAGYRGGSNRCRFFLTSYSINNFYCGLICRASSWPGLGSFRRRLLRSSLRSCLSLFGWWRFWPHWILRLHPSDNSLYSTRHHLLGRNRRKERFRARQWPRAGLPYYSARIRIRNFPLSFDLLYLFLLLPHVAVLRWRWMCPFTVHALGGLVQGPSCSRAHLGHTAAELHLWAPCPYFWHLQQRSGFGINGSTFTLKYPMRISFGRLALQKVKKRVFVSLSWPSSFLLMRLTNITPCSLNSSRMSVSLMPASSRQRITPREEFRVGWMLTIIGLSTNFWDLRRRSLCFFVSHSTKKVPFLSRLIDLSLPEIRAWKPLSMANGDNLVTGSESSPDSTKRNRGQFMVIVLVS